MPKPSRYNSPMRKPDASLGSAPSPAAREREEGQEKGQGTGARRNLYYIALGALTLLVSFLPYLYGFLSAPGRGLVFTGLIHNADDGAVYYSWMRQAASGRFFLHNQFAIEEQRDVLFNLFYWLLGGLVRVTGLPIPVV